jgi:predicted TIM-barrel fold metal-dependent hydrolase
MKKRIQTKIDFLEKNKNTLIIDADTHITDITSLRGDSKKKYLSTHDYYHGRPISAEDLLAEMEMAAVDMCLIWQNPACTHYNGDISHDMAALLAANEYIYTTDIKYPNKFIPAGWTDPKALGVEKAIELAVECIKGFGFPIVKMNPAQNEFPIDSEPVIEVVKAIVEMGAVPAFHYGADTEYTPAEGLQKIAELISPSPLLGVHMGGGGPSYLQGEALYIQSREIGLKYPNIRFVESAKRDTHIESDLISYRIAGPPYENNIFCASDAPYGRQTWCFGGFRAMLGSMINNDNHTDIRVAQNIGLFDTEMVQNYLGRNFANFAIEVYKKI